jgi:Protein of unknown function, DUF481
MAAGPPIGNMSASWAIIEVISVRALAVTTILALAATGPAWAQQADPVSGKASLGYLATSGNTESTSANAAFNLVYARPAWSHEFDMTAVTAETDATTTAESYSAAYEGRRDFGEKAYLFAGLGWKSDKFSSYDQTTSETVGYGRHFIETDAHELDFEAGVGARDRLCLDRQRDDELHAEADRRKRLVEHEHGVEIGAQSAPFRQRRPRRLVPDPEQQRRPARHAKDGPLHGHLPRVRVLTPASAGTFAARGFQALGCLRAAADLRSIRPLSPALRARSNEATPHEDILGQARDGSTRLVSH